MLLVGHKCFFTRLSKVVVSGPRLPHADDRSFFDDYAFRFFSYSIPRDILKSSRPFLCNWVPFCV